jgi:hypothetical protein
VHAVPADEGRELIPGHRPGAPARADADIPKHIFQTGRRDHPEQFKVQASGILDAVPHPAAHKNHAAAPERHPAALEHRDAAAGVNEDDFVLVLVQVHGDRGTRPKALAAGGDERRPGMPAINLDRHIAAAGGTTQPQRFTVPRTEHQPRWLHRISSRRFGRPMKGGTACPRRQSISTS